MSTDSQRSPLLWLFALVFATFLMIDGAVVAQDDERMITRLYPVYDLVITARNYPYPSEDLPSVGEQGATVDGYGDMFGIMGGMGGMGGGMGGGGGMFAVPGNPRQVGLAQMASSDGGGFGGGMGGMGGGGMSMYGAGKGGTQAARNPLQYSMDDLIGAIAAIISPDSWDEVGGAGAIEPLGGVLIVRNSATVHEELDELLKSLRDGEGLHQTVTLAAYWLQLGSKELQSMTQGQPAGLVDAAQLQLHLGTSSLRYRGQITCLNGQTVYLVSGDRHMIVTGAIPVVGSATAYQPQTEVPNAGVLLQTTTLLLPGGETLVDVQSTVTTWRETELRQIGEIEIDCPVLATRQLATTVRVKPGEFRLVGGLTAIDENRATAAAGKEETPQLYLVIQVPPASATE